MKIITSLLIITLITSCTTQRRCNRLYPPEIRTTIERHTETVIKDSILPGSTVYHTIHRDSLIYLTNEKWHTIRDTSGLAELRYYRDAYGNLMMTCEALTRSVETSRTTTSGTKIDTHIASNDVDTWWKIIGLSVLALLIIRALTWAVERFDNRRK